MRQCLQKEAVSQSTEGSVSGASAGSGQRIQSSDYGAWEKYDVETECTKVEEEEEATGEKEGGPDVSTDIGKLSERGEW